MVGSAPLRKLGAENVELVTASRSEADLRDQARWFAANHVGAVTSPLQIGITAYGIPPDGVQVAIRILPEHGTAPLRPITRNWILAICTP